MEVFPKRKELASLKQLFVLHGKISIFLHALPLNAGTYEVGDGVNVASLVFGLICFCVSYRRDYKYISQKNIHFNERSDVASRMSGLTF